MCIYGKYCCLVLQGVTYAPEIHRTRMCTEYTCYKRYVIISYEVQDTNGVFENSRTPVDGGGGTRMEDVRLSRGRSCAYNLPK